MRRLIATSAVALMLSVSSASAQNIRVYFDLAFTDCDATVLQNTPVTFYIVAELGGPASGGIIGAEFRLDGVPASWLVNATPNPAANLVLGSPLTGGCNMAFPSCQTGSGGKVLLYTISGFATSLESNLVLTVNRHTTPSDPTFACPVLVLCDPPLYSKVCACGGEAVINGAPSSCGCGAVPANEATWGSVKALYR